MVNRNRERFLNLAFDNVALEDVLSFVNEKVKSRDYGYAVSLNVDMVAKSEKDVRFREDLMAADLILMDSVPLIKVARSRGIVGVEKLAGSDLLPQICKYAAEKDYSVCLVGGRTGVPEQAASNLQRQFPGLRVVGAISPDFGFERDVDRLVDLANEVATVSPDIVFLCMGAPKSEALARGLMRETGAHVAFCFGAAVDFAAGNAQRAPAWVSEAGFEWLYRFLKEPKRLFRRYFIDSWTTLKVLIRS